MDIRWRNYSHSLVIKIIVFIVGILCFTNAITILADIAVIKDLNMDIAFEKSYFQGADFLNDSRDIVWNLRDITEKYQSEEHVLKGDTLSEAELRDREEPLFGDFRIHSKYYHPNLSDQENYTTFKEVYADKIAQLRDQLIKEELQHYNAALQKLKSYPGLIYYAKDGDTELTNSPNKTKDYFKSFPTYMIFDGAEETVSPAEIKESPHYSWINSNNQLGSQSIVYIAFTKDFSNPREEAWANNIIVVDNGLYQIAAFLLGWAVAAIYLLLVIGRNSNKVQEVQFNFIDRIYNDFKLVLCFVLMGLWVAAISWVNHYKIHEMIFPITFLVATLGSILVLSFVKHLKNKTLIKQTIVYALFHKLYKFIKDIYDSGSVGVKVAIIVIGYPALVALTFFMFPITIGAAAWIALKKVKEFNVLKEGVQKVKEGDIHYTIDVPGDGEFGKLAADINSITDGLSNAVQNELKSERLKTELITNVSHDIRTPLTSIITYVDLLKKEKDPEKAEEYLEIIDQKSQRLKILTDDLFEAAKASSGNIPVNYETIDIVSLITQGLGELDDKIHERNLDFKLSYPQDKVYLQADGKLLWRAIENLLSNIFKYALAGSRVYLDVSDLGTRVMLTIKNISAYELNISAEELMERFKRGDESRTSQGSGLGLSIAKSLIEAQKGNFNIEIDGDLFKAIIQMTK